jgi:hypothetical protein
LINVLQNSNQIQKKFILWQIPKHRFMVNIISYLPAVLGSNPKWKLIKILLRKCLSFDGRAHYLHMAQNHIVFQKYLDIDQYCSIGSILHLPFKEVNLAYNSLNHETNYQITTTLSHVKFSSIHISLVFYACTFSFKWISTIFNIHVKIG